jgi:hypothetical protein
MASAKLSNAVAILSDVLAACKVPGGATFGMLVRDAIEKRRQQSFDAIAIELAKGANAFELFDEGDKSEFIQMALRLNDAIAKGAAIQNLRLLAQVIVA